MRRSLLLCGVVMLTAACRSPVGSPGAATVSAPATSATSSTSSAATSTAATSAPSSSSAPPATLQSAFQNVQSGVVRLEVAGCGQDWQGSGFELSPTLIATVGHVVNQGQVVRVIEGTTSTAGTVIGMDQGADVALVQTVASLAGHAFTFADTGPRVGDEVAALGFPRGEPLGFDPGTINGLGRKADVEGSTRHDMLEMDAATHPGSSGGPVIRADGTVVGLVDAEGLDPETGTADQGRRFAVSSATAQPLITGWTALPRPVPATGCSGATYPDGSPVPASAFPTRPDMQSIDTLQLYFTAINGGDFATALAQLISPGPLSEFQANVASTRDDAISFRSAETRATGLVVWVTFTSHQDPGKGPPPNPQETCTTWSLDYEMAQTNGLWLIRGTSPHDGTGHASCSAPPS